MSRSDLFGNSNRRLVDASKAQAGAITIKTQTRIIRLEKFERIVDALQGDPIIPGDQIHIISFREENFFGKVVDLIRHLGKAKILYISTWTLDNKDTDLLIAMLDHGLIGTFRFLSGINFKNKNTSRYTRILKGMDERNQKTIAFKNHSKIVILQIQDLHLTISGSANLSGYEATEQYTITASKALFDFHRSWMDQILQSDGDTNHPP